MGQKGWTYGVDRLKRRVYTDQFPSYLSFLSLSSSEGLLDHNMWTPANDEPHCSPVAHAARASVPQRQNAGLDFDSPDHGY